MEHPQEIIDFVEKESGIKDHIVDIKKDIQINIIADGSHRNNFTLKDLSRNFKVEIENDGKRFSAIMDRPLIHQLGNRIWPQEKTYIAVAMNWLQYINESIDDLRKLIVQAFYNKGLVIRYDEETHEVYGIVSTFYKPTDQLDFRDLYLSTAEQTGIIDTTNSQFKYRERSGNLEEIFRFQGEKNLIELEVSLIYGKNTGYNSYKNRWYRKTTEEGKRIWLSPWESKQNYEWRNNSHSEIKSFVDYIVNEGLVHQQFINERAERAMDTSIEKEFIDFFLQRMLVAYATKDRIRDQFTISTKQFGRTVWALSHSLRFLGSSDKHTQKATKWLLIETGTLIFEREYKDYLEAEEKIKLVGDYAAY